MPRLWNAAIIGAVGLFLVLEWMPLGPEAGLLRNLVFVTVVIGGLLSAMGVLRVGYVPGAAEHDKTTYSYNSASKKGGIISKPLDAALIGVSSVDTKRKVIVGFTPGKSILTNAFIPCVHADPFTSWELKPGQSAEVTGVVIFTEDDIESVLKDLAAAGIGKPMDQ